MKRGLLLLSILFVSSAAVRAQQNGPPTPPSENLPSPRPRERPGMQLSVAPQAVVPVPIVPPRPNGPVQKSLVRITSTEVEPDYRAPWNSGVIQRGIGAGFVIEVNRILTNAHVVS